MARPRFNSQPVNRARPVPVVPLDPNEPTTECGFTVIADKAEKRPYRFQGMHANADKKNARILVPVEHRTLPVGDYTIKGLESEVIIERKSKEDFFGSVARHDNFKWRLEKMSHYRYSAVVVECEWSSILWIPVVHSDMNPKNIARSIQSWDQRYPTKWHFLPDRDRAEAWTFRLLERFYLHALKDGRVSPQD